MYRSGNSRMIHSIKRSNTINIIIIGIPEVNSIKLFWRTQRTLVIIRGRGLTLVVIYKNVYTFYCFFF